MRRSLIPLTLALFAFRSSAVQAAAAKGGNHRVVRSGACTQQSTSKLKLSREDRGIEVEFQVDQNRNGVPWHVTLRRNGFLVASLTVRRTLRSGSFDLRRADRVHGRTARITATATRSGETCTRRDCRPEVRRLGDRRRP